jgi:hypothetical protein
VDDRLRARLVDALNDPGVNAHREQTCQALAVAFREVGRLLWVGGSLIGSDRPAGRSPFQFGSDATVGLATVAQVAGELTEGAVILLQRDNLYGAAALIRQLVEVEYLAWAFAEDQQEATAWLRSTRDERLRLWQPRQLRDRSRGRFRATDYGRHCDRGGHPTPEAMTLLPDHSRRDSPSLWRVDLITHSVSTWEYVQVALAKLEWGDQVSSLKAAREVRDAIEYWRENDPLHELLAEIQDMSWSDSSD